jgi:hypothetical protein
MFPVVRQSTEDPMIKKSTTIAIAVASALLAPVSVFAQGTGAVAVPRLAERHQVVQ